MIPFMKHRRMAYIFSLILLLASWISFFTRGFNFGIDFTGGVLAQVRFNRPVDIRVIRDAVKGGELKGTMIQRIGETRENLFIIKAQAAKKDVDVIEFIRDRLVRSVGEKDIQLPFERSEEVGPTIGADMRRTAYILIFISLLAMMAYISFRFTYRYAAGGILALFHDVSIVMGAFSVMQLEVDMTTVAAVLTIIGYSINDTIVVYDRIRESMKLIRDKSLGEIIDISINSTLSRTIITGFTTLLVVIILFFMGGPVIHNFSLAFIIGIIFGTYSSIFVATPVAYDWETASRKRKQMNRQNG